MAAPIGYIVWWDLKKAILTKEKLLKLRSTLNIKQGLRCLTKRAAFRRTTVDFRTYLSGHPNYILDKVQKSKDNQYNVVVLVRTPRKRKPKIRQAISIRYKYGELTCRKRGNDPLWIKFKELYKYNRGAISYTEMTKLLVKELVSAGSLILHPKGRIYFVPYDAREVIKKLREFVSELDGEKNFWAIPQVETPDLIDTISASLNRYVDGMHRHFNAHDRSTRLKTGNEGLHLRYCKRGKRVIDYYCVKFNIDLKDRMTEINERIRKFEAFEAGKR